MGTNRKYAIGLLVLTCSCAFAQNARSPQTFVVRDDPENRRFVLQFKNSGNSTLCLSPATWPDSSGTIPITSALVSVSIGSKEFRLDTAFVDFGNNAEKVRPRTTVTSYLSYSAFKIPDGLAMSPKILHLSPAAVVCD